MISPKDAPAPAVDRGVSGADAGRRDYTTPLDVTSCLEMALAYAGRNWHVLSLYSVVENVCNCWRGAACSHPGKHPRTMHGLKDATCDPEIIARWFDMWPASNVGIATGAVSGLVVIDIDFRNGAEETLGRLADEGKFFTRTAQVRTPSGGFHLYYRHPGGYVRSVANALGPGIDIKGDGGLVVAPPSVGINPYYWQVCVEPEVMS